LIDAKRRCEETLIDAQAASTLVHGSIGDGWLYGTNDMTDSLNEQLSACLDGQLPEAELDLLLKRAGRDAQLGRTLGRYALVGEALRGRSAAQASSGFADRVAAAIAADAVPLDSGGKTRSVLTPTLTRWLRPAAGFAVAAGVATLAVFSFQMPAPESTAIVAQQAPAAAVQTNGSDSYIVPANPVSSFIPAARLTNYVVAHSEYSSPLGRRTVLSGMLSEEEDDQTAAADTTVVRPERVLDESATNNESAVGSSAPRQ
jgi:negative regulator of sigma E activity